MQSQKDRLGRREIVAYFPLFFELEEKWVLVVGAGSVASRRIRVLLEFGARVAAVAPESSFLEGAAGEKDKRLLVLDSVPEEGFQTPPGADSVRLYWLRGTYEMFRERLFSPSSPSFFLVIAASGAEKTDSLAACDGRTKGAFVNVASDRLQSDFYFPGIAQAGSVTAGITAGGRDHRLARQASEAVRELFAQKEEDWERENSGQKNAGRENCLGNLKAERRKDQDRGKTRKGERLNE